MDTAHRDADKPRLILVDDEEALLWSLSNRIAKQRPEYIVESATDGHTALGLVKSGPTDLLITDISMEGMRGTELILLARQHLPGLPVIVITAYATPELESPSFEGSLVCLDKPFEFDVFLRTVDNMLESRQVGFSGAISTQTLSDIVQLYALSNATGALRIRYGTAEGMIWFDRGNVVHASTPNEAGAAAFHEIMQWSGGEFSMQIGARASERSIRAGWAELLMESCRIMDERRNTAGPTSRRGWSMAEATPGVPPVGPSEASSPAHVSTIRGPPFEEGSDHLVVDVFFGDESVSTEENVMDYKGSVNRLNTIDGFIGAAIVDSESGMLLSQEGGGSVNLEVAAGGNTEVVRAKRKVMRNLNLKDEIEDILITLGKQYHILRPLRAKPTLFFYLVLDRSRANLALARLSLADVEKEM